MEKICSKCKKIFSEYYDFCPHCGKKLEKARGLNICIGSGTLLAKVNRSKTEIKDITIKGEDCSFKDRCGKLFLKNISLEKYLKALEDDCNKYNISMDTFLHLSIHRQHILICDIDLLKGNYNKNELLFKISIPLDESNAEDLNYAIANIKLFKLDNCLNALRSCIQLANNLNEENKLKLLIK